MREPKKTGDKYNDQHVQQLVLAHLRMSPTEIIDIGVDLGTPFLYNVFPDASYILVDPIEPDESSRSNFPNNYRFLKSALGAKKEVKQLHVHEISARSTFNRRTELTKSDISHVRDVEMTTLDCVISDHCTSRDIGIKIDAEGHELEILKGLNEEISKVSFLIVEVSNMKRFQNGYRFSDIILELSQKGFELINICNQTSVLAPRFFDCLFLPKDNWRFDGETQSPG